MVEKENLWWHCSSRFSSNPESCFLPHCPAKRSTKAMPTSFPYIDRNDMRRVATVDYGGRHQLVLLMLLPTAFTVDSGSIFHRITCRPKYRSRASPVHGVGDR